MNGLQYVDLSYNQLISVPVALMQCRPGPLQKMIVVLLLKGVVAARFRCWTVNDS